MKRILIYLLLVISMAVVAQQATKVDEEPGEGSEKTVAEITRSDSAEESGLDNDGDSSTPEITAGEEGEQAEQADGEIDAGDLDAVTTDVEEDAAPSEEDFEPEEEISEDYPVPLPSDI